jgi:predicted outer membrane protein
MKFLGRGLLVATTALLLTALGFAQSSEVQRDQYSWGGFGTADPQFLREAAQDGAAKMQLAYLALQNAQNEQVKSFAVQMLSDPLTDVSRFKQEATKGSSEAMKNWASQMLPTLESALKEAQKVAPAVGVHSTVTSKEQLTPSVSKPINPVSQEQSPSTY